MTGRADVILDRENGSLGSMALVDYKTATDPKSNHIHEFQLAIYSAAGRAEGIDIRVAYVHDLAQGERRTVAIGNTDTTAAKERATRSILGIAGAQFPAEPEKHKCGPCDVRFVCEHGPGR